jgi:hypothetical protein
LDDETEGQVSLRVSVDNKKIEERQENNKGETGPKILSRSFGTEDDFILINFLSAFTAINFQKFSAGTVSKLVPCHNCMAGPQVRKEIVCKCVELGTMPRVFRI